MIANEEIIKIIKDKKIFPPEYIKKVDSVLIKSLWILVIVKDNSPVSALSSQDISELAYKILDEDIRKNSISKAFSRAGKRVKNIGGGFYEIMGAGREEIKKLDQEFSSSKPKIQAAKNLRDLLQKMKNHNENSFLREAISCFEIEAYRATIIMSWLLTLDHLFDHILKNKINEFNNELIKQNLKIKKISSKDDFLEMKEERFIEICRAAGIITNDIKKILDEKLGIRNSCAHPNSIIVKEAKATNFVEDLIENIVLKY